MLATVAAPLDLGQARLLRQARQGDARALESLWDGEVDTLWSICAAVQPREQAIGTLRQLREGLSWQVRSFSPAEPWRTQIMALLWRELSAQLSPFSLSGILQGGAGALGPGRAAGVSLREAIAAAPAELRMVYFFNLLGGCQTADIASFSGESDMVVRGVRARMAWALVPRGER